MTIVGTVSNRVEIGAKNSKIIEVEEENGRND